MFASGELFFLKSPIFPFRSPEPKWGLGTSGCGGLAGWPLTKSNMGGSSSRTGLDTTGTGGRAGGARGGWTCEMRLGLLRWLQPEWRRERARR